MCRPALIVFMVFASLPVPTVGQSGGRHGGGVPGGSRGSTATPAEDPDLTGFKMAVAVQATEVQSAQFRALAKSTEDARKRAETLQQLTSRETTTFTEPGMNLQDSVDEAQQANRKFLATFSDPQVTWLKKFTKKLDKSNTTVTKEANKLKAELDRQPLSQQSVAKVAGDLGRALSTFQADQLALAKAMGIATH